jgi:hydrogenase nickel incorporation protein HypA/HybF
MHEYSLMANLIDKISVVARKQQADRVTGVTVRLGALSHISADHFREHFVHGTKGTIVEDAHLTVIESQDTAAPDAQDVVLQSVEVEE